MLADKGYYCADDHIHTPYRGRNKPAVQQETNRAHAPTQSWPILRELRCRPWRAGQLPKATLVLQAREVAGCRVGGWRGGVAWW